MKYTKFSDDLLMSVEQNNELCWSTGNYTDECDCEFCSHKNECSGYEGEEE